MIERNVLEESVSFFLSVFQSRIHNIEWTRGKLRVESESISVERH